MNDTAHYRQTLTGQELVDRTVALIGVVFTTMDPFYRVTKASIGEILDDIKPRVVRAAEDFEEIREYTAGHSYNITARTVVVALISARVQRKEMEECMNQADARRIPFLVSRSAALEFLRVPTNRSLRNYELEEGLERSFPVSSELTWVISDWCPYNGVHCTYFNYAPRGVLEETLTSIRERDPVGAAMIEKELAKPESSTERTFGRGWGG
jgi:hypothetical protein